LTLKEKGKGVEASRLRQNPRLLFANTVNHVGRAAESLSEDVNIDIKKA
jgi:hypothetical protein